MKMLITIFGFFIALVLGQPLLGLMFVVIDLICEYMPETAYDHVGE